MVRTLEVTALTDVKSLAVRDIHITVRWKQDPRVGSLIVRVSADDLQFVTTDNGVEHWHIEYEITAREIKYRLHYRGSSREAAANNTLNRGNRHSPVDGRNIVFDSEALLESAVRALG